MPTSTIGITAAIGGISISGNVQRTATGQMAHQVTLQPGKAGTLTTRTDDNTGVATLATGHGIVTSDKVDVYWEGGIRYGMEATVSGDAVTVDGGDGDNLPIATTTVIVSKQVAVDVDLTGDNLVQMAMLSVTRAHVHFATSADASVFPQELTAGAPWTWSSGLGVTNPIAGAEVAKALISNGSSAATSLVSIAACFASEV